MAGLWFWLTKTGPTEPSGIRTNGFGPEKKGTAGSAGWSFGTVWLTSAAFSGGAATGSGFPAGISACTTRNPIRRLGEFATHDPRLADRRKRIIDE